MKWAQPKTLHIASMTIFFTIVALLHVVGLFAMMLAMRRAPVAVQTSRGFMVIAEPEEVRETVGALARTA